MDLERFSSKYSVRRITDKEVKTVFELCRKNTLYYEFCPPMVTEDSIRDDMAALPPRKGMGDKYYVGYFDNDKLIAVLDLILAYPDGKTAYIGFFMTDTSVQRKGVGSFMISELCGCLREQGYEAAELGWVKGNYQSEGFWHKNDFHETSIVKDMGGYTAVAARRRL